MSIRFVLKIVLVLLVLGIVFSFQGVTASETTLDQHVREFIEVYNIQPVEDFLPNLTLYRYRFKHKFLIDYSSDSSQFFPQWGIDQDGRVTMHDVSIVVNAFDFASQSRKWDQRTDLNSDGEVDITVVGFVCAHFKEQKSKDTLLDTKYSVELMPSTIPEFYSVLILLIFLFLTLFVFVVCKRRHRLACEIRFSHRKV